jgi:uncharacterized integral membrane protein
MTMLALILFIAFGILFSFFATLNTSSVAVYFGIYTINSVPIYLLVLLSVALGTVFASIFYFVKTISYKLTIGQKNKELSLLNKEITQITKELHEMEIENAKLKTKSGDKSTDDDSI